MSSYYSSYYPQYEPPGASVHRDALAFDTTTPPRRSWIASQPSTGGLGDLWPTSAAASQYHRYGQPSLGSYYNGGGSASPGLSSYGRDGRDAGSSDSLSYGSSSLRGRGSLRTDADLSVTPRRYVDYDTAATQPQLTPNGPGGRLAAASVPRSSTPGPSSTRGALFSYESATPRTSLTGAFAAAPAAPTSAVSRVLEPAFDRAQSPSPSRSGWAGASGTAEPHGGSPQRTRSLLYESSFGPVTYVPDADDPGVTMFERPGSPAKPSPGSRFGVAAFDSTDDGRIVRTPSMIKEPLKAFLPEVHPRDAGKLVVVLDLDETLVYAREGRTVVRPGCRELLHALKGRCELLVWTAGERDYAQSVIREIDVSHAVQHCVYRHPKWWTGRPGYTKNLLALGRPLDRTIIIDNTPDCLRDHPHHSLLVSDFLGRPHEQSDTTLFTLRRILDEMIDQPMSSVPNLLSSHPDVTLRRVQCDTGGAIEVFTLSKDIHLGSAAFSATRRNMDLPAPSYHGSSPSRLGRW